MAQVLRRLESLSSIRHPDLLAGIEGRDDAAVFRLSDRLALVQSVDYFPPIVDEAYDWGRIAAANALSDIYAMGARPLLALQLIGWPRDRLPLELIGDLVEGAGAVLAESGCVLAGGHSIDSPEPAYGFAVTGVADPADVVSNRGGRPGDRLVLTKPVGTGVVATGIKRGVVSRSQRDEAVELMTVLNAGAARAMGSVGVHAATDVTGFGLLGHLGEMLGGAVGAVVDPAAVPLLPGSLDLAGAGVVPGGTRSNLEHAATFTDFGDLDDRYRLLLADAQTSGGLLIAVPEDRLASLLSALRAEGTPSCTVIGALTSEHPGRIVVG